MSFGSLLKKVAITAAPVAIGAVTGSVEIGGVAAGAIAAAGGAKWAGKKYEAAGGRPLHKTGAPVASVGASLGLGQLLSPEAVGQLCGTVQQVLTLICDNPKLAVALPGIVMVAMHGGISDLFKSLGRPAS